MHAEGRRGDEGERPERAAHQLGQVEPRHRLHHLAAALRARAVRPQDGDADDQIAHGPVSRPQRPERVRGDDAADGRLDGVGRIERQPLPALRQFPLELCQVHSALHGHHLIGGRVLHHLVQPAGGDLQIDRRPRRHRRLAADEEHGAVALREQRLHLVDRAGRYARHASPDSSVGCGRYSPGLSPQRRGEGKTLPGLNDPPGSNAQRTSCIVSRSAAENISAM